MIGHGGIDDPAPVFGEDDQRAAPVARIAAAGDVTRRLEPVEPMGHAGWRQHQRRGQLCWSHHERIAAPAERGEDAELYRAVGAGDLSAASHFLDAGVVLHVPGTHPLAGAHVGRMAFARFSERTRAPTVAGEQIDVLDVLEGDDHVAVYCRVRAARPNGAELDNTTVHLLRIVGGVVTEAWLHNWDDVAVDRFWS